MNKPFVGSKIFLYISDERLDETRLTLRLTELDKAYPVRAGAIRDARGCIYLEPLAVARELVSLDDARTPGRVRSRVL